MVYKVYDIFALFLLTTGMRVSIFLLLWFVSNTETTMSDMEKLNGDNFALRKSQMEDILIHKDQCLPIEGVAKKPSMMAYGDWKKMDREAIATVREYLAKNLYFNVAEEKTTKILRKKFNDLYEKNTTVNKVLLMKKLYNLKMKEGASIAEHLNEFNVITN